MPVLEGSLLYIGVSELPFRTFSILLLHFPIKHRHFIPRPLHSRARRRTLYDSSVKVQSFGHRCYRIRRHAACRR